VRVEVLYFAGARDVAGKSKESCELPASVPTVAAFLAWLVERYPALEPYASSLRIAQNEMFVDGPELLSENDTLAVIPPVAGG